MESFKKCRLSSISIGIMLAIGANTSAMSASSTFKWSSESAYLSSGSESGFIHVSVSHSKNSGGFPGPIILDPHMDHSGETNMPEPFPPPLPEPPRDQTFLMIHHSDHMNGREGSFYGVIDKSAFVYDKTKASLESYVCISYIDLPPPMPIPMPVPIPPEPVPMDKPADMNMTTTVDAPPPPDIVEPPIPHQPPIIPPEPPGPPPVVTQECGNVHLNWELDGINYHKDKSQGEDKFGDMFIKRKSKSQGGSAMVNGMLLGMQIMTHSTMHHGTSGGLDSYSSVERFNSENDNNEDVMDHDH